MKKHRILFLGMVGCILLSGCSIESNTSGTGENTLEEVFDSYKEELKKTYSPTDQDFLVSGAAFRSSKLYDFCQKMPKGNDNQFSKTIRLCYKKNVSPKIQEA